MKLDWMKHNRWGYLFKKLPQMRFVCIGVSGNEKAKEVFRRFSSPHPRYLIIPNKALGVALVKLPSRFAEYLQQNSQLKRKRNRTIKLGYSVSLFDANERLDDILAVNSSMRERQGRAIDPEYLDRESLKQYFSGKNLVFGAFLDGKVCGYIDVLNLGDVCLLGRIMGHSEHLENGVMYLLVSEVVQHMISRRNECGSPQWMMYDTMFGASEGLRFFKEQCGFSPFFVKWRWNEAA